MIKCSFSLFFEKQCCFPVILLLCSLFLVHGTTSMKHYIVYMGEHSLSSTDAVITHNHAMLASAIGSDGGAKQAVVHHYTRSFRGFSAMLTAEQAQHLEEKEGVISIFESGMNEVQSTHSWDFLGVDMSFNANQRMIDLESDVIIGSIDTGVWPESESFKDTGLGPVPPKFKGQCTVGENFTLAHCNRKIIGARYYYKGFEAENGPLESVGSVFFRSARDSDGHGSHTASTAAGSVTSNVSLLGMAAGRARGGAVGARIAVYKACWFLNCSDADLLAAFDDAVSDGVDIISLSVGSPQRQSLFFGDAISIGAFHAFRSGVVVSTSAGNSGLAKTVGNVAPWILTVAASSIDRNFNTYVHLGNSKILRGTSLNPTKLEGLYGIILASSAAAPGVPPANASSCPEKSLSPSLVDGKIVVCTVDQILDDRRAKAVVVQQAGGVGMILVDPIAVDVGFQFVIPSALIGQTEAMELQNYLASDKYPAANISQTATVIGTRPAPKMAVFSSKGPNIITPDIIKPDITAPGLNILAAWSPVAISTTANRQLDYNIMFGTSMSCPHVTGAAALLKSRYGTWSPAAIMSALMTTAKVLDNTRRPILRYPDDSLATPFDYGSGHVQPIAALNPGLVYDFDSSDVMNFLCSNGATPSQLKNLTGGAIVCEVPAVPSYNFNYPSIGVANVTGAMSIYRTVTNVQEGNWFYKVTVENPAGVNIRVVPDRLSFCKADEKKSFRLNLVPFKTSNGSFVFGSVTWSDGTHRVRSPIALNVVSV